MLFKPVVVLSVVLPLTSAMTFARNSISAHDEMAILSPYHEEASVGKDCDKEDEADCKEFCGLSSQTGTCAADGNKITCYCKGGKSESNCEERCLLCMPDKSALEEGKRLFKLGKSKLEEL